MRATDAAGSTTAYSALAGLVAATGAVLAARTQPSLAGIPSVGQTLAVQGSAYTGSPTRFVYVWLRCNVNGRLCAPIADAGAASYAVTGDDAGHALIVQVTATGGGATQIVLSTAATIPA